MRFRVIDRLNKASRNLVRDKRGNVLLIAAAALFPILGIIGSGVDIGRAYMTKLRLQQACDAGVLAGRRAMAGGLYSTDQRRVAEDMFYFNFPRSLYGTSEVFFTSSSSGSADVVGSASADLPTVMMHIFGFNNFDLDVNCGAKLEIANTDVMLVLDTTGSMGSGESSKLGGLKKASNDFLDTLMQADVGDGRIRIGVVPYALAANVGAILRAKNPNWISDSANLPSLAFVSSTSSTANYELRNVPYNVSALKNGGTSSTGFGVGLRGGNVSMRWDGCVTEMQTTAFASTATAPSGAWDISVDRVPNNEESKWKMYLPGLTYPRAGTAKTSFAISRNTDPTDHTTGSNNNRTYPLQSFAERGGNDSGCPSAAMKLTEMTAAGRTSFRDKISALTSQGYTYHDAGMVWGGRLLSQNGILADENAIAPNGKPISRHLIFMTDGDMDTGRARYSHQGVENAIVRIGSTSDDDSDARHINRFKQVCGKVRDTGATIWVVAFGFPAENRRSNAQKASFATLLACADGKSERMFDAATNDDLGAAFVSIAGQISRLRVSQ